MIDSRHEVREALDDVLTPALAIYPEIVRENVERMRRDLGGDVARWRPHIKTAKLDRVVRILLEAGVARMKCATTLEAARALALGVEDLLVAFPHRGANLRRVADLARAHPRARVSVLVEDEAHLAEVAAAATSAAASVGVFIDINPGMDRTGIRLERGEAILALAREAARAGRLRGLHPYDGHLTGGTASDRRRESQAVYDRVAALADEARAAGVEIEEICTSGTPTYIHALAHERLRRGPFRHTVSPGTVIYWDARYDADLPEVRFTPAALVLSRVVAAPRPGRITADAGHKQISADAGDPVARCLSHEGLTPRHPSEEHLPIDVAEGARAPRPGEVLYLVPRHVCPTVNNAGEALIVEGGRIVAIDRVEARGHEVSVLRRTRAEP
jgi:D-serine deaminase-like pyridoxal phosphate-dependent protein